MDQGFKDIKKIIAPAGVEVHSNYLKIGDKLVKTFFILSYPRYLATGWFESIINLPNIFDVAIYINPVDTGLALKRLRKKTAQIESQISDQQEKGMVRDPMLETALSDVENLRDTLQQSQEKFFSIGVYIAVAAVLGFAVRLVFPMGWSIHNQQLGFFPMYVLLFAAGIKAGRGWARWVR